MLNSKYGQSEIQKISRPHKACRNTKLFSKYEVKYVCISGPDLGHSE